ncbi:MAG: hypothetical protein GY703_25055, partial [Gammaproteobacteria bacterium]|nr:hypothetical protein [Gammaproteobacteria bacterium]
LRELERYVSLTKEQRILWLSRLLFFVSMFARDTYDVGTESVDKPEELRRFNELLHRISSKQLDVVLNEEGMPDNQFFGMVSEEINRLHIEESGLIERLM